MGYYNFEKIDELKNGPRHVLINFLFKNPEYILFFYQTFTDDETRRFLKMDLKYFSYFQLPSFSQQDIFLDFVIMIFDPKLFNFDRYVSRHPESFWSCRLQIALLLEEAPQFEHYILNNIKNMPEDVLDYLTIKKLAT